MAKAVAAARQHRLMLPPLSLGGPLWDTATAASGDNPFVKAGEPVWLELSRPRGVSDVERRRLWNPAAVDERLLDRQVDTAS